MSRASSILIIFTTITLVANHVSSEPPTHPNFQYILCDFDSGSYSYDANLQTVFTTLQTRAYSSFEFYSTSSGTDSETVYGQYYCRGDIDPKLCGDCIQQAKQEALTTCALAKSGIVWYEECTLRYSDESIYGVLEPQHPYSIAYSSAKVSADPQLFSDALRGTLNRLIGEAVNDLFATGEGKVNGTDYLTVYGLVQCSPDLSKAQCDTCLKGIFDDVWTCCGEWPTSVYAMYPSCEIMYNTDGAFYYSAPGGGQPPTPSSDQGTPPPSPSTDSKPPTPSSKAAPPPLMNSTPPPQVAPSPLTNSKAPAPSSTLYAPPPLTGSQPPPPPSVKGSPPPGQSGSAIVRSEGMKLGTITVAVMILMFMLDP